jgi:hypothetical protein
MAEFDILIPLLFNVTDCSQFLIYTGFSPYEDIFIDRYILLRESFQNKGYHVTSGAPQI